ncbi:conserved hypothetical protein [Rubrobacter xylanophilus DSM 9941]|uniref:Polyketide cyclase n=1 Tax=Rubrobacter xylanophilus (strain DSM 9941 / JCM 11954 / NBRC 16129 / PRD-1) TaxID=266117 RepID=Q1AX86_RUBXD|nr:SRPBCC family protein [Rubrobacter xylanophilus]ABG03992.1 conserved hypothetical protein [Rubrobacter xylanophilus DSM 9941]
MSGRATVDISQRIMAPAGSVASYLSDFRNARNWMVGVEEIEDLGGDAYRLHLESPVGRLRPEARVVERSGGRIRWVYTSTVEGGGTVEVRPEGEGCCTVRYTGSFAPEGAVLRRAARLAGMERFARRNGERSLVRLKALMEAGRYR